MPMNRTKRSDVSWVGQASRLPYSASRGIHPDVKRGCIACGRSPGAARDARHGRRDAHPTQTPPLCFITRLHNCERWSCSAKAGSADKSVRITSSLFPSRQILPILFSIA